MAVTCPVGHRQRADIVFLVGAIWIWTKCEDHRKRSDIGERRLAVEVGGVRQTSVAIIVKRS